MKRSQIENILLNLSSGRVQIGWTTFLDTYSPLMRKVVRQFEADECAADDCYEYVCAKLSDRNFERLRSFDTAGPARFRTWLTTVTGNLCRDWRRSVYGRWRAPKFLQERQQLEQIVFQYIFRQGMTYHECLHSLKGRYPKLSADDIRRISRELYESLSTNQRWQLGVNRNRTLPAEDAELVSANADEPESRLQKNQDRERLEKALASLEPRQRLLLLLRYQQDLTLGEIARLTGLDDPFRARRAIDKALADLQKIFNL